MGNFFQNLKYKFIRFMQGRYGVDQFNRFLMAAAFVLLILSMFFRGPFYIVGIIVMVYGYFRMFSKNHQKRYNENLLYMGCLRHIKSWFNYIKLKFTQRKTHRIYRCKKCGQNIRVPKGKGRIRITCPKCRNEFEKVS